MERRRQALPLLLLISLAFAGCIQGADSTQTGDEGPSTPELVLQTQPSEDSNVIEFTAGFEDGEIPSEVFWVWGDGLQSSGGAVAEHRYFDDGAYNVTATADHSEHGPTTTTSTVVVGSPTLTNETEDANGANTTDAPTAPQTPRSLIPHVIIGIPDTGINPYHEMYFRPELSSHPCTYIKDYPCDIPALPLSVGPIGLDFDARLERDLELWQSVKDGDVFWIPRTVFIGVICESPYGGSITDPGGLNGNLCILDDSHMHGTGTTSSALMENPDALIVFKEGGGSVTPILESGIPIDILSVSWGSPAPVPLLGYAEQRPIYVTSAGNDPRSTLLDSKGDPDVIEVGGAYAEDSSQEILAGNQAEVVSYYCRPVAQTRSIDELRESYCGTSFAAPTVAGALSKVVLEYRVRSGYTGSIDGDYVDPLLALTKDDVRNAMRHTASYNPESQYPNTSWTSIPLNPVAPYTQWGWGFFDGTVADDAIQYLDGELASNKSADAVLYLETIDLLKDLGHPL